MKKVIISCFCLLFGFGYVKAQEEEIDPIATDRPLQSETATTVPKGYIQMEMGGQFQTYSNITFNVVYGNSLVQQAYKQDVTTNEDTWTGPNILLKYGLFERLELRLTFNYIDFKSETIYDSHQPLGIGYMKSESGSSGVDAPLVGLKYKISKQKKFIPGSVISVHSKVPLWGSESNTTLESNIQTRLTMSWGLIGSWYLTTGIEDGWTNYSGHNLFYVAQTGVGFCKKFTWIFEFYGNYDDVSKDQTTAINGALVYLIHNNHQIDISAGKGLGDNFYDVYYAIGYSFRIPIFK